MRVYLGSDHAGFELKQRITEHLKKSGHEPIDCGAFAYDAEDDYPAFCIDAATRTVADTDSLGIVIGGSGNGEQIAANKVPGARCALAWSVETATLAREHNNAQLIGIGGRMHTVAEALTFASKAGADPARVREALMGGFAASRVLEVHGERMIRRTFDPGFRIELHQKDLGLALGSARALGMALPHTASAQQLFGACVARGGGGWDHSAMVRAIEMLADHPVRDG